MDGISCGIYAAVRGSGIQYRGIVECESRMTWRGLWRESKLQAMRDADKQAEIIYDLNHNVLTVKRFIAAGTTVRST